MSETSLHRYSQPQLPLDSSKDRFVVFNAQYMVDVPQALDEWNCKRTVLVVSTTLNRNTDKIIRLEEKLERLVVGKKVGVGSHTPYPDVLSIAKLLSEHSADSIVCIGSSSYSDACKIARLLHEKLSLDQLTEYEMECLLDQSRGATRRGTFSDPKVRLICIPCSLSVSEYNPVSSATNSQGKKQHFGDFTQAKLAPDLILLDPEIAATAPMETLWLVSGARAVDHCIETICSATVSEEGVSKAYDGLRAMIRGLCHYKELMDSGASVSDERVLKSIADCQKGARNAIMSVFCYNCRMGPSHAIGHQVGSVTRIAHGLTSCLCLPATLKYEREHPQSTHWRADRQPEIVRIFNEELGWSEEELGDAVERLFKFLGLPTKFHELGITEADTLKKIAERTMTDIWGGGEQQLTTPEEVLNILNRAK